MFNLFFKNRLPQPFQVVGIDMNVGSDDDFRASLRTGISEHAEYAYKEQEWQQFLAQLHFVGGNYPADRGKRLEVVGYLR